MVTYAVAFDYGLKHAWTRLLVASGLSLLLHLALLLGVPVNPTGGMPDVASLINARLEPAADATPAAAALEPERPAGEASAVKAPGEDPLAEPEPRKPEVKPEPKPAAAPPPSPSTGIELPLIRDPTYYPAKQLDVYPQPLAPIRLHYPESAVAERVNGRLLLLLLIDEYGVVNEASVVESEPPGYFEEAARSVFRAARFAPGMKDGRAVKSRVLVQVRYVYGESEGSLR